MNVYISQFNSAHSQNLMPLAAGMIVSYARSMPELSKCKFEIVARRGSVSDAVACYHEPIVIGFSCYLWNIDYSLAVAAQVKAAFPNTLIVMGGPSVPRRVDDVTNFFETYTFVDVTVAGEGELAFSEIVIAYINGASLKNVAGIAFRSMKGSHACDFTSPRDRLRDLNQLPSPFLDGTFDHFLSKHADVTTGVVWETNRGCPFSCTFCDWGQAVGNPVNTFDIERLAGELEWIARIGFHYLFCADANFGIKKRDLDIARLLVEMRKHHGSPKEFFVNWTKNSYDRIVSIAELLMANELRPVITLSVQSMDRETLQAVKRTNINLLTFQHLKQTYGMRGIPTYTDILLGLPGETYSSFCNGLIQTLSPSSTHHLSINSVIMLPNAEMSEPVYRKRYGIETRTLPAGQWRRVLLQGPIFEREEIVVATSTMPFDDWKKAYVFAYLVQSFHDFRLAHCIIDYIMSLPDLSARSWIEYLASNSNQLPDGILARIIAYFNKLFVKIDEGLEQVVALDIPGLTEVRWQGGDAVYLLGASDFRKFYSDLRVLTKNWLADLAVTQSYWLTFDDLLNYQEHLHPTPGLNALAQFSHDWRSFFICLREGKAKPSLKRQVEFRFTLPVSSAGLNFQELAVQHLRESTSGVGVLVHVEELS